MNNEKTNANVKDDPSKTAIKTANLQMAMMDNLKKYTKYWMMFFYVILVGIVFWTANNNPSTLFSQKYTYLMTILTPLFLMIFLYFNGTQYMTSQNMRIAAIVGVIILACYALIYYAMPKNAGFQFFAAYGFNILIFLIIVVGFAIIFNVFRNATRRLTGWSGFMFQLFFFIPCLLSDYLDYLKREYTSTPPVVFTLFIAEILLILAYIYLPKLLNRNMVKNSVMIQKDPMRLDVSKVISNNRMFHINPKDVLQTTKDVQDKTTLLGDKTNLITAMTDASGNMLNPGARDIFTTNFGLSMWIYVNEKDIGVNEPTDKTPQIEIPIFKYGNTDNGNLGKPSISYVGNSRWKFNFTVPKATISGIKQKDTHFILSVPSQKWNQIVFNYYDNKVDLWINGNLERNMDLHLNPIKQTQNDIITVGSKSGLMGGICNIQFYSKPMTLSQISQSYNLLYSQNPPVNNLY